MSGVGDLLGALLKGRVGSSTLNKAASRRAASKKAQARLKTARDKASAKQRDLLELEQELQGELIDIEKEYDAMADSVETLEIGLEKSDIRVAEAKLLWVPVD
jgi:small-conductance mechanosensitive channel